MAEMEDRWLSISEICKHLGVSKDTVYKWIDEHKCPRIAWAASGSSRRMRWTNGKGRRRC